MISTCDLRRKLRGLILLLGIIRPAASQSTDAPRIHRAYLDTTCAPCKDFWRFANGAWIDSVKIPAAATNWGRDDIIQAANRAVIHDLLDSLSFAPSRFAHSRADRNVGAFYRSCMDTTLSPARALAPLSPELRRLSAIRSRRDVSAAIGRLNRVGVSPLFWFFAGNDRTDPTRIIGVIRDVSGMTMQSRQAYTGADSMNARLRERFVESVTRVFLALGDPVNRAALNARRVLAVETAIAGMRASGDVYEKLSISDLNRLAPSIAWGSFTTAIGRPELPTIDVRKGVLPAVDSLMRVTPVENWGPYLRWQYVLSMAPFVDRSLEYVIDKMYAAANGRSARPPRAVECVTLTTWRLGDDVARAYVARSFSPEDRRAATALVEAVRAVFRDRLQHLEWLSPATRQRALAKLAATRLWIGYPDTWDDDSSLVLHDGPAASLFLSIRRSQLDREFSRIGKRANQSLWIQANPAFVDLSYYPVTNALLITAAALQPPAFSASADALTNLANIGLGIGHELSHGFDAGGRLYNEKGQRDDWWTPADAAEYNRRAELVVNQYNEYVVIDSLHKDGRRTLNENLADIGGVALAYETFKRAAAGLPDDRSDGFTREQRFFIALAQSYPRIAIRPEELRIDALSDDGHHVPRWRLNGALANLAAFAAAFGCKEGDPMVLPAARRGNIW